MTLNDRLLRWRFRFWPRFRERHERHYWMPDPWAFDRMVGERPCALCKGLAFDQRHYFPEAGGFA